MGIKESKSQKLIRPPPPLSVKCFYVVSGAIGGIITSGFAYSQILKARFNHLYLVQHWSNWCQHNPRIWSPLLRHDRPNWLHLSGCCCYCIYRYYCFELSNPAKRLALRISPLWSSLGGIAAAALVVAFGAVWHRNFAIRITSAAVLRSSSLLNVLQIRSGFSCTPPDS
jgi:hypothetical protein